MAILQLAEAGKLQLEDSISNYVPGLGARGEKITLVHLLTHTSGLPNYTDAMDLDDAKTRDLRAILTWLKTVPDEFEPGANWAYNNTGYYLLGAVVEKVTGVGAAPS